ncbi:LLM class flavin-dependent oxidoreductase [Neomicrococcus aestuarii]
MKWEYSAHTLRWYIQMHTNLNEKGIPTMAQLEIGAETFGDIALDDSGQLESHADALRNVVNEGILADQVGLDFFGVGEHHRDDMAVSAPEIVLAAIASRTENIHLGTAVTVLSSDDPVRLYQRFATLDAISNGRAEIIAGRGSFIESFPLFGYNLQNYEQLFEEKLDLLAKLVTGEPVTWSGETRTPLRDQTVYPLLENAPIKTWVGVGGSPQSVVRAARHNLPLTLAIIGGNPLSFEGLTRLYRRSLQEFGHAEQPISAHLHGLVTETDEEVFDLMWPHYQFYRSRIGQERGWPEASQMELRAALAENGHMLAGSPETVARKMVRVVKGLGLSRIDIKYSQGTLPHSYLMKSLELLGTKVKPMVLDMLSED